MKSLRLTLLFGLMVWVAAPLAQAIIAEPGSPYTFQPSPADLYDLDHYYYYTWGIQWTLPEGEQIVGATLSIADITNWNDGRNVLYIHLIDDVRPGVLGGRDNQGGGDQFLNAGPLIAEYHDTNGVATTDNLDYHFGAELLADLNDFIANNGNFGFGFDPDCHFWNEGVTFTIETEPAVTPEPATISILALGLTSLGLIRRRRSRKS